MHVITAKLQASNLIVRDFDMQNEIFLTGTFNGPGGKTVQIIRDSSSSLVDMVAFVKGVFNPKVVIVHLLEEGKPANEAPDASLIVKLEPS